MEISSSGMTGSDSPARIRPNDTVHSSTRHMDRKAVEQPKPEARAARAPRAGKELTEHEITRSVELANDLARRLDVKIKFRKSEDTDEFQLEVVDRQTGEVIRKVPPEEMVAHLDDFGGFEGLLTRGEGTR